MSETSQSRPDTPAAIRDFRLTRYRSPVSIAAAKGRCSSDTFSTAHGLTVEAYRERWGLKPEYPVVAPSYATRCRDLAKTSSLGIRRGRRRGSSSVWPSAA